MNKEEAIPLARLLCVVYHPPNKGDELLVYHTGIQHVFDFSQHSGGTSRIQRATFNSDCIHQGNLFLKDTDLLSLTTLSLHNGHLAIMILLESVSPPNRRFCFSAGAF